MRNRKLNTGMFMKAGCITATMLMFLSPAYSSDSFLMSKFKERKMGKEKRMQEGDLKTYERDFQLGKTDIHYKGGYYEDSQKSIEYSVIKMDN